MSVERRRQRAAKHSDDVLAYRARREREDEEIRQREEAAHREKRRRQERAQKAKQQRREAARRQREIDEENEQIRETNRAIGHEKQRLGEESEQRVLDYLDDQKTFPWIFVVQKAAPSQPGYDFTLKIDKDHPLSQYIQVDAIYVDAKSSHRGVDNYFSEQAQKHHKKRNQVFCELNKFALCAGPEAKQEEIDLQMVLQILLLCEALFDEEKTTAILNLLDERLVNAYRSQELLINEYVYTYVRTYLVPDATHHN